MRREAAEGAESRTRGVQAAERGAGGEAGAKGVSTARRVPLLPHQRRGAVT